MSEAAGPGPGTIDEGTPLRRDGSPSRAWGCLRAVGLLLLILLGLAVVAFIWLYVSLSQSYKAPEAVTAPVSWMSRDVVLSPDRPAVHGRLTLSAKAVPSSGLQLGLNAGAPVAGTAPPPSGPGGIGSSASAAAALLSGPVARVTAVTASGTPQTCLAPCELALGSGLACGSGSCSVTFDVTIELDDGGGTGGSVTVAVAGGATAQLDGHLPDGFIVDLALDGAVAPGGS